MSALHPLEKNIPLSEILTVRPSNLQSWIRFLPTYGKYCLFSVILMVQIVKVNIQNGALYTMIQPMPDSTKADT